MSTLPDISTLAQIRSARVKCFDFHPTRPQLLIGLYSGEIILYDYKSCQQIKQIALLSTPIRAIKYIAEGVYFVVGSDDGKMRVYDSYSLQLRTTLKAHKEFLRAIILHPQANIIITAGDDTVIRAWSYNSASLEFILEAEYTGHSDLVMSLSSDPLGNRLLSASRDKTVKVWDISYFINLEEFHNKAASGKIGAQMGKRDETLMDKLSMKTVNQLQKQTTQALTSFMTNKKTQVDIEQVPFVKFDALFSLAGHTDCVNQAVWIESKLLSGDKENPYAQGLMQFVASVSDDHELLIWDTFSRQIVKKFTYHQDVINSAHYIKQLNLLITTSDDASSVLLSTHGLQTERTFNFGLDRGWCVSSIQSGASTIVAIGYDSGIVILRVGDFAPLCAFNSQKTTRFAVGGIYQHQYPKIEDAALIGGFLPRSSGIVSICNNIEKHLGKEADFKSVTEEIPTLIKKMEYSPNGKFLSLQGDSNVVILSSLTGKKKFEVPAKQFCFASQFNPDNFCFSEKPEAYESELEAQSMYGIITDKQRKNVRIFSAVTAEEHAKIKLDASADKIFSGPLLSVSNSTSVTFYDWEGHFITQLDIQVTNVIWNGAGDIAVLVTPTESYILKCNLCTLLKVTQSEEYDEYNGVDDALEEIASLPVQVQSGTFTSDSKLFIYSDSEGVHQLFMDEVVQSENVKTVTLHVETLKQTIAVLGTYNVDEQTERIVLFGESAQRFYEQSQLVVSAVNVDKSVLQFKKLCLDGQLKEAVEFAKKELCTTTAIEFAAEYLISHQASTDIVMELLAGSPHLLRYAHKLGRFDVVADNPSVDLKLAAEDAFRGGYLDLSLKYYLQLQDWPMVLLCAYILGDEESIKIVAEKGERNARFRAGIILGNDEIALQQLETAALKAQFKKARGLITATDVELWKAQLLDNKRIEVADAIEQ